jgi:hypothetical protein
VLTTKEILGSAPGLQPLPEKIGHDPQHLLHRVLRRLSTREDERGAEAVPEAFV